jgi:plastocyanin
MHKVLEKYRTPAAWLILPLLALAITGCNKTPANQPAAANPQPVHYARIDAATVGAISGTIRFTGKVPTPIAIDMAQDPACGMGVKEPNTTEQYVVHNGRMANVFVYVKDGLGNRVYMPTKTPVVLDQKGCRDVPHVIGAMVGQPVEFRNSDPTAHNVHIDPPDAQPAAEFNISQPPMAGTTQHAFPTAGLMIPIRCDYHPWMEAFLNVVRNPFFSISNADGHFEINGLPPGKYTLVAVQEKLGKQSKSITVQSRKTTEANFTFSK